MLPEAGATELIFIAAVALIVVGPKDLPALLRRVGQFTAKMRGLAAEFRASFDELARQSELDELRREVDALRTGQYIQPVAKEIDQHFDDLHKEFGASPPPAFHEGEVVLPGPEAPPALAASAEAGPAAMRSLEHRPLDPTTAATSQVPAEPAAAEEEAWPQLDLPLAPAAGVADTARHGALHEGAARETAG